ncbi:ribonuclease R [Longibacter salinarum]|uniref:Ribonuclease R n=1 Tax=Longibacter salinarum TaxID=1850348 RepID=A0A2A8D3N5_9BACT|nr:ribonuclease R [Longibacter salinarum]PEN15248.1 ribonuclease R [Longibacter salinarum]
MNARPETASADKKKLRKQTLDFLRNHSDKWYRANEISSALHIKDHDRYLTFCDVIADLASQKLVRRKKRKYQHKPVGNRRVGILHVTPHGYGFVEDTEEDEEYFIREYNMGEALDSDLVRVGIAAKSGGKDKKRECEVLEVIERRRTKVVGTFKHMGHFAFVDPDDQRIPQDVFVPQEAFNGAEDGQKVVVSIDRFEDRKASPEGRILRVIGDAADPNVRVLSLAMSMDVKADFPEEVEAAAEAIDEEIPASEVERRVDLRDEFIFTIDPDDAKDFDDAIHINELDNGHFEVGVHIADVSHYVEPNSPLDDEALERATSTYLVDRTIPMLPEKLSNKVCSLRPKEDKCAFSVMLEINRHGDVVDYDIHESVIHSKKRLTYDQAQTYIDGGHPRHDIAPKIVQANRLAKTLTKKRMREGAIDFGSDEVKVILDEKGNPENIVRKQRMEANRLIEEFMLLANKTVARHIGGKDANKRVADGAYKNRSEPLPFVYRIHDNPDGERIRQLAEYVKVFGYDLPITDGNVTSQDLGDLIDEVRGSAEETVITRAALRAMSKAEYNVKNIGHFGLGFDFYSHFTSPIRRYPDLVVHRLLKRYATSGKPPQKSTLQEICEHCSEQERNAEQAERESVKLKQVEYTQQHVGDSFKGVVSGVTKFGVFVELTDLLVEGLVHVREMDDDYYMYDETTYTMEGEHTGKSYRPGDECTVQVTNVDVEKRQIDLLFANDED